MKNKGQITTIAIITLGLVAMVLIIAGLTIGWSIVKSATDEIIPELNSIGEVSPGINISEYTDTATKPVNSIIENLGLIMGLIYILGIMGILSYAFIFRSDSNGWILAFFIALVLALVLICILISNFYEEFYLGSDVIGETLRSSSLVSYLIIYSPIIMGLVSIIAGIILFTGKSTEGYGF